tara:strand:- start:1178 stop:1849 length:672 start_codon:yes stop_codon:yes gene_type:complete
MLTVIIPVLNEVELLPRLLKQFAAKPEIPIIVVDGGSTDETVLKANQFQTKVLQSLKKGRSIQMNLGAQAATTEYLLFLHADVILPDNFFQVLEAFMNRKGAFANCAIQFDLAHWFLNFNAFFTRYQFNSFQFGDQGLIISKALFQKLGAYNEGRQLVEGQDLIRRAKKVAKFEKLPVKLIVSARKYKEHGVYYLQFCYLIVFLLYRLNFDDSRIQRIYSRLL